MLSTLSSSCSSRRMDLGSEKRRVWHCTGSGYCCARRHPHVQHSWLTPSTPTPCTLAPHLPVVCGKAAVNVNKPLCKGGVDEGRGRGDARRLVAVLASLGVGVGGGGRGGGSSSSCG